MFSRLLLLFITVPLLDLALLIWLSQFLTWQGTVGIVIVSGILGAWLASMQGRLVRGKIEERLRRNQLPSGSLISDGAIILFAAGLLLTPGLLTDLFGVSLLIPPIRNLYKSLIARWFKDRVQFETYTFQSGPFQGPSDILEGKVVEPTEPADETAEPDVLDARVLSKGDSST